MDNILPASVSEVPTDPRAPDHRNVLADVAVDSRSPDEAWSDSIASDPAWYSADTIARQSATLDAELGAELDVLRGEESLLPGFETLTWSDLDRAARSDCDVSWCIHRGLPVHSDGFDPDPDNAPHRSVEHTVRAVNGGESIDRAGRAEVTVQLEQDRDQQSGPTVTLAVVVRGIEQYAWLTLPETRALQHALGHLVGEADNR